MNEMAKDEREWSWKIDNPLDRLLGPVEMFWRGLGYQVAWHDHELKGERELAGQLRRFTTVLAQPQKGIVSVRCVVEFEGPMRTVRPGEPTQPAELVRMLGRALARGFGPPAGGTTD